VSGLHALAFIGNLLVSEEVREVLDLVLIELLSVDLLEEWSKFGISNAKIIKSNNELLDCGLATELVVQSSAVENVTSGGFNVSKGFLRQILVDSKLSEGGVEDQNEEFEMLVV